MGNGGEDMVEAAALPEPDDTPDAEEQEMEAIEELLDGDDYEG